MIQKYLIIIYCRVSSASQSLELQLASAKRYLESIGLKENEDFVIFLNDHDVSATKLKMNERPQLMELIRLIKEGKVKTVVVYKRDRLARNFYEFVDIVKILNKYDVEVVYTATNEAPFKNKLAIEAFHGMFSQMEGQNIRSRTSDARKQYPPQIFGYKKIKNPENKNHYLINKTKKDIICSLFNDFSKVQNEEHFLEFLLSHKKGVKDTDQIIRILTNPFYAGNVESKDGYQPLGHVEPMISLDLFLQCKSKIEELKEFYSEKLLEFEKSYLLTPICGECNNVMKHRKENPLDLGYFVCSDKHKRNLISFEELNELVIQTVLKHIQSISIPVAKKIISKDIATAQQKLEKVIKSTNTDYLDTSLKLCTLNNKNKAILTKYLLELQELKNKSNEIQQDLLSLQQLRHELRDVSRLLSQCNYDFKDQEIQQLVDLLVDQVFVFDTHVHIDLYFSSFTKDCVHHEEQ